MKKINLYNISIADVDYAELLKFCLQRIRKKEKTFIITLNSIMVINYLFNKNFRSAVDKADLVIPDGYGIILAGKIFKRPFKNHLPGIDVTYKLFGMAFEKKLSVFLLGSSWPTIQTAYKNMMKWFPQVRFLGRYSGYFNRDEEEKIIQGINKLRPDILFVGMGTPKQEVWINNNLKKMKVKIVIGVGGSFDVFSGFKKRAPLKWRKKHLEWLYRCLTSPSKFINIFKIFFYFIIMLYFKLFKGSVKGRIIRSQRGSRKL
ncbi:MAG: WecB/TagA/CpsF family glycosyltransferase [Spirochaetes bacterium]|nr:WecB/TagA/CpsF family glycosyltransferase [Spirochaetota bacterium]